MQDGIGRRRGAPDPGIRTHSASRQPSPPRSRAAAPSGRRAAGALPRHLRARLGRRATSCRARARLADEAAFLPAALSLQETPAHPAPRRVAWAHLRAVRHRRRSGRSSARSTSSRSRPGASWSATAPRLSSRWRRSVVKRVLVKDGDAVQAGQVLVELDATNASADRASVRRAAQGGRVGSRSARGR